MDHFLEGSGEASILRPYQHSRPRSRSRHRHAQVVLSNLKTTVGLEILNYSGYFYIYLTPMIYILYIPFDAHIKLMWENFVARV